MYAEILFKHTSVPFKFMLFMFAFVLWKPQSRSEPHCGNTTMQKTNTEGSGATHDCNTVEVD